VRYRGELPFLFPSRDDPILFPVLYDHAEE
jgi:hypothetical protein